MKRQYTERFALHVWIHEIIRTKQSAIQSNGRAYWWMYTKNTYVFPWNTCKQPISMDTVSPILELWKLGF